MNEKVYQTFENHRFFVFLYSTSKNLEKYSNGRIKKTQCRLR